MNIARFYKHFHASTLLRIDQQVLSFLFDQNQFKALKPMLFQQFRTQKEEQRNSISGQHDEKHQVL